MAVKSKGNEYSVYAGIDDSPPVNWGTIAGTISDQLLTVKKDREAQKAAIEQQTVDQMAQLNKLPDVNDRSLSKILIEGSDRSKQELQMRMKLVKSGAIKPKDYTLFMNEQKNGYSEFSNVIKNWDKWNEKKMESIKNGTASAFDQANALSIESFGNLQNKTIMTNPANGQLQVVTMLKGKDGKYTKMPNGKTNPENFSAPGTLNSRMAFDEEKKVTSELVNKEVAFIGEEIKARSLGNGVVETVEDFTQSAAYPDWKKASIAKLTSNDYDIVQILAEDPRYVIASSQAEFEEKNPGVDLKFFIEMDQSGNKPVPKLREGQKKAAEGMVDTLIESQLGRKEDRTREYDQNSSNARGAKKEEDNKFGRVKAMNDILSADNSQDALNRIDTDSTYQNVESMQMVDESGNNVGEKDWAKAKEIKIDYYDPKKGEMTQGTVRLFDDNGNKKSSDKIVMDMVEKLGIPTEELESYKAAFKKKQGTFNPFKGIANYKRAAGDLVETGTVQVDLGSKKINVSQGVSNVLKEDFKDENIDEFEAILTDNTQTPEDKQLAEDKLDSYRWSLVTSMVNKAVKPKLRGKGFKLVVGENGALSMRVGTEDIDLGLTKASLQNDGSRLMTTIEEKINSSKGKTPGKYDEPNN